MAKANPRLDAARQAYREALVAARTNPSAEAWARLLAAGKALSAATEPPRSRRGRKPAGAQGEQTGPSVDLPNLEGVE